MGLFRRRFTGQGAPPGEVAGGSKGLDPRISVLAYNGERLTDLEATSLEEAKAVDSEGLVRWIDISGLGDGSVIQELGEHFGVHTLAISDAVNVGQRPKVEQYDGVLYVVLRMVTLGADHALVWEQVSVFLGSDFVLTVQETHEDCLDSLRTRIRAGRRRIRTSGSDFLACMVIDAIVDGYFPVLEFFGERLEYLEDEILKEGRRGVLEDLYVTKRNLAVFRRATWPLREGLAQVMRGEEAGMGDVARLHLRDVLDHAMQVVEVTESYRELAASLVDVHLSMVGQRTNDVMRVLTVVSAIFIPLTFVAGIYGMNFDTSKPANLPELRWAYGYPMFWLVCIVLGGTLLVLFRRLGWLKGS